MQRETTSVPNAASDMPNANEETASAPPVSRSDATGSATRTASPATGPSAPLQTLAPQLRSGEPRRLERYELIAEHGRGGLGRVSRARDHELSRDVAIKELISRNTISELRFLREVLITARLQHPGIVPIYEAGQWSDGTPFYAMQLVAGRPLRELIAERLTVEDRLSLLHHVIAVADAIAYAHDHNIIHRDLKPSNIIVGDFGETVVIDWGLAKDLSGHDEPNDAAISNTKERSPDLTSTGSVLGTPAYMAPEQERGEHVDQRADVFAIGAMLWELCSLQKVPPSNPDMRHQMLRRTGIDRDLATIIDKSLSPAPSRRYPNAGALAADLKSFKAGSRISARNYSILAILLHWTRRHRIRATSIGALLLIGVACIVIYVHNITAARDVATTERDKAQLAEAALLLDKDPTSAKALLGSITNGTAQHALLLARADSRAATTVLHLPSNVTDVIFGDSPRDLVIYATDKSLSTISLETSLLKRLDSNLTRPLTMGSGGLIYTKRGRADKNVLLINTSNTQEPQNIGSLLAGDNGQLVQARSSLYIRNNTDLYKLEQGEIVLQSHDVKRIAGNDVTLMICTVENKLTISQSGTEPVYTSCAANRSTTSMVVAARNYAALLNSDTVLLHRNSATQAVKTHIVGEYALAIAESGAFALADFNDKAWFIRPYGEALEVGPSLSARPRSAVAAGRYVAWGYDDGSVAALDTTSNEVWQFKGHNQPVLNVLIDPATKRLISIAGRDIRVWQMTPSPITRIADLPCKVFNILTLPDQQYAAMDAADGVMRFWSRADGKIRETSSRHTNIAFGLSLFKNQACSAGIDGRVLCSSPDGGKQALPLDGEPVPWLTSTAAHDALIIARADGAISEFDGSMTELYTHSDEPYRMALTADDRFLASGDASGYVIIYDRIQHKKLHLIKAHEGLVTNVAWRDQDLWTAGRDGTIKHWSITRDATTLVSVVTDKGPARLFHLTRMGWIVNVDERILTIAQGRDDMTRLDIGRRAEHIDVDNITNHIVVSSSDEIIVIDPAQHLLASVPLSAGGTGYVGFVSTDEIAISTEAGLSTLKPSQLHYNKY